MTDQTDDLQRRASNGEAAAFGLLIRRLDHDLRGVAWSVVRSAEATDDVMQTTYERAFRSIGSFDGRSSLKTWLHSICYRTAIDHVRHESRRDHEPIDNVRQLPAAGSTADAAIGRLEFGDVLRRLEPDQRAMLMLTAGLGYSFDETAEIVGRHRGTVASKVSRARRKISRWEAET